MKRKEKPALENREHAVGVRKKTSKRGRGMPSNSQEEREEEVEDHMNARQ